MSARGSLLTLAGVSGAAVMVGEMTLLRVMAPYFGQTHFVWTIVIGVVMAALAAGYAGGGVLADRLEGTRPLALAVLAGAALLAVVPFLVKPLAWALLPAPGPALPTLGRALFLGAFACTLLLVAPPIALLGVVGPWVTRLLASTGLPVGRAAGRVLAVSTLGSLVGTFAPTLWLVPTLGSRLTVVLAAALLAGAALLLLGASKGRTAAGAGASVAVVLIAGGLQAAVPLRGGPGQVMEFESPYQYGRVVEHRSPGQPPWWTLALNEGGDDFHTKIVADRVLTGAYYDWYVPLAGLAVAPDTTPRPPLRIAILGLAGGAHSRAFHALCSAPYTLAIDGVEIDPAVVEAARAHLQMTAAAHPHLRVHTADARPWLAATAGPFDLIIIDAFTQQLYVPFYLATREFFTLVHQRLAPGGVCAFNVFPAEADGELVGAFAATLGSVFGAERVWGLRLPRTDGNFLMVARKDADLDRDALLRVGRANITHPEAHELALRGAQLRRGLTALPTDGRILTDDDAPVEILTERDLARMRARALEATR